MKKLLICLVTLGIVFGAVGLAMAGNTATQTVTYQVSAINEASVTGNPSALTVSTATAGSDSAEVTDSTTFYAITTNGTNPTRVATNPGLCNEVDEQLHEWATHNNTGIR